MIDEIDEQLPNNDDEDSNEDDLQTIIEWHELAVIVENLRNDLNRMRLQEERRCSTPMIFNSISQKNLFYFGKKQTEHQRISFSSFDFDLVSGFVLGFCIYPTVTKYISSIRWHR